MTFDPTSVEVTCVTLPKDHCVQVPWEYINVCGYSDQFCKKLPRTYTYILHTYTYYIHILRTESVITYSLSELRSGETKNHCSNRQSNIHQYHVICTFSTFKAFWESEYPRQTSSLKIVCHQYYA